MKVTFTKDGMAMIDDARIRWRNFAGRAEQYNPEGKRNFTLVIPDMDIANAFLERGWGVKIAPPRAEGDSPFIKLKVNVRYGGRRDPEVFLYSGGNKTKLDENTIKLLDDIDIERINMDIRPHDWQGNGEGCSAYLESIEVFQNLSRFAARFAEEEGPGEPADLPWD